MEDVDKDYVGIRQLDTYEHDGLDERQFSDMDEEDRRDAELKMKDRDRREKAERGRMPGAILGLGESEDYDDYEDQDLRLKRRQQ